MLYQNILSISLSEHSSTIIRHTNILIANLHLLYLYTQLITTNRLTMDDRTKEKLAQVKKLIVAKNYQEALDECEVMLMKNSKILHAHMFAGFCLEKLNQDKKAEKAYKEAEDLDPKNIDCLKALYGLYNRLKRPQATLYLDKLCAYYQKTDKNKYKEFYMKLLTTYQQQDDLEKLYQLFTQTIQNENEKELTAEIVAAGCTYFKMSISNQCFSLQHLAQMGTSRKLNSDAREQLDRLLVDVLAYLRTVGKDYNFQPHQYSETIAYLRDCFPDSSAILYLYLLDPYSVTHVETIDAIFFQIKMMFEALHNDAQNSYTKFQYINPDIFAVTMLLTYQYLTFLQIFFTLDTYMQEHLRILAKDIPKYSEIPIPEQLQQIISDFVLTKALECNRLINSNNQAYERLNDFKALALKHGGFLEEVVARLAMGVFKDYKELNDMKNLLKIRIAKDPGNPFLLKYYYDYLLKIGRNFRVFDQEIDINMVLQSIIQLDPTDHKYLLEQVWMHFSHAVNDGASSETIAPLIHTIDQILNKTSLGNSFKATALTRKLIISVHLGLLKSEEIESELIIIHELDPSNYQTLLSLGVLNLAQRKNEEALVHLKEAFVRYQNDYHLNRYIYLCLIEMGRSKEAESFVERIYEGFPNIFWVNYVRALSCMNLKNYVLAESYLTKSVDNFVTNKQRSYLLSFQKIYQRQDLSSPYLILQNKYRILDQYLILPETQLELRLPLISNSYYKINTAYKELVMWLQMSEALKIQGRLSSALKCLKDAESGAKASGILDYAVSTPAVTAENWKLLLQICLLLKEIGTLHYFYGSSKQAIFVTKNAVTLCKKLGKYRPANLLEDMNGLLMEIEVSRISNIMRFQTYETTSKQILNFRAIIKKQQEQEEKEGGKRPKSVIYLKSLYQLRIISYFVLRTNSQEVVEAINNFLGFFRLNFHEASNPAFGNRYFSLNETGRMMVREAIEDLCVFMYIQSTASTQNFQPKQVQSSLKKQVVLNLLQLFPDSPTLYIIYGILEENIKRKTGAFLKCIQIDKFSPLSIDFLAGIYLKDKNFLPASKLFLKSIEVNPLNLKSYYGLIICLFSVAFRSTGSDDSLAEEAAKKIYSYLQYLKTVDPSTEYSLMEFIRSLLSSKGSFTPFQNKLKLFSGVKAYQQLLQHSKLSASTLIESIRKDMPLDDIWDQSGQEKLIETFCSKHGSVKIDIHNVIKSLIGQLDQEIRVYSDSRKDLSHHIQQNTINYFYKKINIVASLIEKSEHPAKFVDGIFSLINKIKKLNIAEKSGQSMNVDGAVLFRLKTAIVHWNILDSEFLRRLDTAIPDVNVEDEVCQKVLAANGNDKTNKVFQRHIALSLMRDPNNDSVKKHLATVLVVKHNKHVERFKQLHPKTKLLNQATNEATKMSAYKKLITFYNDASAWVLYIYESFKSVSNRTTKNLRHWGKVIAQGGVMRDKQHSLYNKARQLLVEIEAYLQVNYGVEEKIVNQKINDDGSLRKSLHRHKLELELYKNLSAQAYTELLKVVEESSKPKIIMNLIYTIASRYQVTKDLEQKLINIEPALQTVQDQHYYRTLRHLLASRSIESSEYTLVESMQAQESASDLPFGTAKTILSDCFMRISKSLQQRQFETTDMELNILASQTLTKEEDKALSCFFEILLSFYQVDAYPHESEIVETFNAYFQQTIGQGFVGPRFASLLYYLKGLVLLKVGQSYGFTKADALRHLQKSALLFPPYAKFIMNKLG